MPFLSRRNLLAGGLASALIPARSNATSVQTVKTVFMVLWRGETEVEAGFRAYFAEQERPVDIIVRSLGRDIDQLPGVIEQIATASPDLVYSWGTSVTLGLAGRDPDLMDDPEDFPQQITNIPLVFTMVSQPIKSRIIKRYGPTGRNVTGVSHIVPLQTQFNAMQAYMPVDRIAVIFSPTEPNSVSAVEQLWDIGQRFNIRVDRYPVPLDATGQPDPAALPRLVEQAAMSRPQFLYFGPDSFIGQYAQRVTELANMHRLATFASVELLLLTSDALFGLVAPYRKVGRLTAAKVDDILFGGKRAHDIPVERLPEFSYIIRADIARQLGIFPRLSLLDYAHVVDPKK